MKKLTEAFNSATVAKGEVFEIELAAFTGSGYQWEATVIAGKAQLLSQEFNADPRSRGIGDPLLQKLIFKADESGAIEIRAEHKRSWENAKPSLAAKTFKVTVS